LWQKAQVPDDRNRIELTARCLLVRDAERCILVETGLGDKFDDKRAAIFACRHPHGTLVEQLAARGISPDAVTDVILTHLHFDHCGGTTYRDGDKLTWTFPRATYRVQRQQWEWAQAPSGKDAGSYRAEDFALLADSDLLLVDGDAEVFPDIRVSPVHGHTPAMQRVHIRGDDGGLLFCADLVPTKSHLRWPYIMAYDNQPLDTLAEKQEWLPRAARDGDIVVFGHEATCDGAILRVDEDHDAVVIEREINLS